MFSAEYIRFRPVRAAVSRFGGFNFVRAACPFSPQLPQGHLPDDEHKYEVPMGWTSSDFPSSELAHETQLQEFSGLMRGGCHADSLLVFSGEACAVTDSLAQDFPVERRSLPGQLRGQLKLRRCWVVAWHRGKPTLGDLPLDVEVDFIKTKAPAKRNLREESVVVRASSFQRFATADRWKKVQHRPGAQLSSVTGLREWVSHRRISSIPGDGSEVVLLMMA